MPLTTTPTNAISLGAIGTIALGGAEITAFDPTSKRLYVTSGTGLRAVDLTNPAAPTLISTIDFVALGLTSNDVSSVAIKNGVVAVSLIAPDKTQPGTVALLNASTGALISSVAVGANPDMVTFTPNGTKILVANEGELAASGVDSEGSISIIDISGGAATPTLQTATFTSFNGQEATLRAAGVRIFDGKTVAQDVEPEYIAVSPDGTKAMITLQENNAVALLDIATATVTGIVPLGTKDFSSLLADFSDRDGAGGTALLNLTTGQPVRGMYMPDSIASFAANGQTYYVMANEGDDRDDFLAPDETIRVGAAGYDLDNTLFPNEAALKANSALGRLNVSNAAGLRGDTDNDGDIDQILAYGGRSFSIVDANGARVFDSADIIDRIIATNAPSLYDDTRSDNKSAEPEGIAVSTINGRTYAFVGLERTTTGSIMVFDITNPTDVSYTGTALNAGDVSPEGLTVVTAADSPNGKPLLIVSNEVSNTVTNYEITASAPAVDYTLQLLHFADAEAGLLSLSTAKNMAALVDAYDNAYANTLILSGGDNWLPGPFLAAGTDPNVRNVLNTVTGSTITGTIPIAAVDIAIHNLIGVEASAIGNHEFDLGSRVFRDSFTSGGGWVGANFVHVSANLDFSGDADLSSRFTNTAPGDGTTTLIAEASTLKGRIAPAAVITKGGEKIGLVGATTQLIESISSPSGTEVKGFPTGPGPNGEVDNMALLAAQLQPIINELIAEGVDKIVLQSHLQLLGNEQLLATLLTGVDIILAAGSNTRLGDANDVPATFPGHAPDFANTYPLVTAGADGKPTLIVNTDNEYTYLGRLKVDFDANGEIIVGNLAGDSTINGAYAATTANVAAAWGVSEANLATTAFAEGTKGEQVEDLTEAVGGVISAKDGDVAGFTNVYLQGERIAVRNQETNLGNVSSDANLTALRAAVGPNGFVASLKNGGGIRAQIGTVSAPDPVTGEVTYLPPPANPTAGKPAGGVSTLDIENSLRFNNLLMAFDTTATGLKAILEHGVASYGNQGRFPQIGGVSFSFDTTLAAGSRVRDVALLDDQDRIVAKLVDNGVVQTNVPATITLVTLNFLANGGDGYPMKGNGDNFRYLLANGTLSAPLDEALDFTAAANIPANALGEQTALYTHFDTRYATAGTAFNVADTAIAEDLRIQNLGFRSDTVLERALNLVDQGFASNIVGSSFGDLIDARGGNDTIDGGLGNDTINGGLGLDRSVYSFASMAAAITRNPDGTVTVAGAGFTDTLSNIELLQFSDRIVSVRQTPRTDLNASGTSDLLLQSGGTFVDWIVDNGSVQSGNVLASGLAGWTIAGTGDFNGDSTGDALVYNAASGTFVSWNFANGQVQSGSLLTSGLAGFTVGGVGDFNADGTSDIIVQDAASGTFVSWLVSNGAVQSGSVLTSGLTGWSTAGTGDFNGDGTSDVLVQNAATGTIVAWTMTNGAVTGGAQLATGLNGWNVVGTGDLDRDGDSDIVLQNGDAVVAWIVQDGTVQSGSTLGNASGFTVRAVGDYNNDGTADIVLQSGNAVVQWQVQNGIVTSGSSLGSSVGFTIAA